MRVSLEQQSISPIQSSRSLPRLCAAARFPYRCSLWHLPHDRLRLCCRIGTRATYERNYITTTKSYPRPMENVSKWFLYVRSTVPERDGRSQLDAKSW